METFKILHIMGTKADGESLEILVVGPEETCFPPENFISSGDTIEKVQTIELEGNWPLAPLNTCFSRAY